MLFKTGISIPLCFQHEWLTSKMVSHILNKQHARLFFFFFFFLIGKKQIYIDNERTLQYTGREQKGTKALTAKKTKTTKKLPTPQPCKKVYNRMCIINTIQISPSPQIGYKISCQYKISPSNMQDYKRTKSS